MNLGELRSRVRALVDDQQQAGYLWSDEEVDELLVEAEQEACLRGNLLRSILPDISVTAGTRTYDISPKTIGVVSVLHVAGGRTQALRPTDRNRLDAMDPGWRYRAGATRYYVPVFDDPKQPAIMLAREPTDAATLKVEVYHYPLSDMAADTDEPSIAANHHRKLIYWAASQLLFRRDADAGSESLAQRYEDKFTEYFGPRPHASMQAQHARRVAPVIAPNPF